MSITTYYIPAIKFVIILNENQERPDLESLPNIDNVKTLISNYKVLHEKYPTNKIEISLKDYCPECNQVREKYVTLDEAKLFIKKFMKKIKKEK
jgi:hypothetical protein